MYFFCLSKQKARRYLKQPSFRCRTSIQGLHVVLVHLQGVVGVLNGLLELLQLDVTLSQIQVESQAVLINFLLILIIQVKELAAMSQGLDLFRKRIKKEGIEKIHNDWRHEHNSYL